MQDGPFPSFPAYNKNTSRKARAFLLALVFTLILAGIIVAGNYFLSNQNKESKEPSKIVKASPTPRSVTPTFTPTPTTAELDKSELKIQVLNGSGVSGAASSMQEVLEEADYTVGATGNADEFEYEETVIQIKKSKNSFLSDLRKALSSDYTVASEVETLGESNPYDAIVIVGEN